MFHLIYVNRRFLFFVTMGDMKLFQIPFTIFKPLDLCPSPHSANPVVGYTQSNREVKVCNSFFSLLYDNELCIALENITWGGKGISACPQISFNTEFADGSTLTASFPCFSFGDPDPCYLHSDCGSCTSDLTCNWCPARNGCLSKVAALDPCSGCLAGFVETCNQETLNLESIVSSDFYKFDPNSDWQVTVDEYHAQMGTFLNADEEKSTFNQYDTNSDGKITYQEYNAVQLARARALTAGAIVGITIAVLVVFGASIAGGIFAVRKYKPELYLKGKAKVLETVHKIRNLKSAN